MLQQVGAVHAHCLCGLEMVARHQACHARRLFCSDLALHLANHFRLEAAGGRDTRHKSQRVPAYTARGGGVAIVYVGCLVASVSEYAVPVVTHADDSGLGNTSGPAKQQVVKVTGSCRHLPFALRPGLDGAKARPFCTVTYWLCCIVRHRTQRILARRALIFYVTSEREENKKKNIARDYLGT